jgi:predicted metalloprotease with PDZ domain
VTVETELSASSTLPVRARVATGADGRFEIEGIPSRPATLALRAGGHHARVVPVAAVKEGERYGPVEVDLLPVAPGERPAIETTGIGAVLAQRGNGLVVQRVAVGGGAAEAGLLPGDEIVLVDGQPISGLGYESTVAVLRGPEGSTVTLDVRRQGDPAREHRLVVPRRIIRG